MLPWGNVWGTQTNGQPTYRQPMGGKNLRQNHPQG